jgi:hypothetical protein
MTKMGPFAWDEMGLNRRRATKPPWNEKGC